MIECFFVRLVKGPVGFLGVFWVDIKLMHWSKIIFPIFVDVFFLALVVLRSDWLPFGFDGIVIAGFLDEGSVDGFKILGFDLRVGFVPGGVVGVFLSAPVY